MDKDEREVVRGGKEEGEEQGGRGKSMGEEEGERGWVKRKMRGKVNGKAR